MDKKITGIKGKITKKSILISLLGSIVSTAILGLFYWNDESISFVNLFFYFIWMFIVLMVSSFYNHNK